MLSACGGGGTTTPTAPTPTPTTPATPATPAPPASAHGNGYRSGNVAMGGPGNAQFIVDNMNTEGRVYLSTVGRGIVHGAVTP